MTLTKKLYNIAFPFEAPLVHNHAFFFFLDPKQVALFLLLETLLHYHLWKCPSGFRALHLHLLQHVTTEL